MIDRKSFIAFLIYCWRLAKARAQTKSPSASALFGKEEKLDKLIIKNQIA